MTFQIPSLPANFKIESFDELLALPDDLSFFPLSDVPRNIVKVSALEMLDATRIPKHLISYIGPTITVCQSVSQILAMQKKWCTALTEFIGEMELKVCVTRGNLMTFAVIR